MLLAIHNGQVEGYEEGQRPIIYIVSSVKAVLEAGLPFVFTDGHATVAITKFFNDPRDLDKIDWELMKQKYWYDTISYPDRKRKRQAEFLVYQRFDWSLVLGIAVYDDEMKEIVKNILNDFGYNTYVGVRRDWYY